MTTPAFTNLTSTASTANASSYATGVVSPAAKSLVIVAVGNSGTLADLPTSVAGLGLTKFTRFTSVLFNGDRRLSIYAALMSTTAPTGTAITVTFPQAQTGCEIVVDQVTDGWPIKQIVQGTAASAGSASVAYPIAFGATSVGYAAFLTEHNDALNPQAGWTELADVGYNTPPTRLATQYIVGTDTTFGASTTGSNCIWGAAGLEIAPLSVHYRDHLLWSTDHPDVDTTDTRASGDVLTWNGTKWVASAAHEADTVDAHDASAISFAPAGSIAATDVQAAIQEIATEAGLGPSRNYSTSTQTPAASTDTYIAGSSIAIPAGGMVVGQVYRWQMALSKNASAGTATLTIRIGSNQTTADAAHGALAQTVAQTLGASDGILTGIIVVRSVNATGVIAGGYGIASSDEFGSGGSGVSAAFDNTALAGQYIGISIDTGAPVWTIAAVTAELVG